MVCVICVSALMALICLTWSLHPRPWAQELYFSSALGLGPFLNHAGVVSRLTTAMSMFGHGPPLVWSGSQPVTFWLDLCSALSLWTCCIISGPDPNPDLQVYFLA